ncbi:MAG: restriction endonuclease subunit S [Planctomycetes bacterium]|nr:restriction endonuclease subunit S [Planctomycetota bacterium]
MPTDSVSVLQFDDDTCPPEWQEVPLSSVADVRFSSVDKKSVSGETPVRLCNYTDVYNNNYIMADMEFMRATASLTEIEQFGLQIGDVIITKDSETPNDIGVPTVVDTTATDLICGYHLALIRPDQEAVDPTFVAKQLGDSRLIRYFGQQANGTTRYGLSTAAIAEALLQLPTVDQQKAVSRIARLLDAVIEKTAAVIAKLKHARDGLLHDLLAYGLDENGELREPDAHPEQFEPSPIGQMPNAWALPSLATLCEYIGSGVTPRGGQDVYTREGVLFIRSQNVTFEGLRLDDVAFIPEHIHLSMQRSEVFTHDVLFNITGASIGRCCSMPTGLGKANVNQHVCIIRSKTDELDARFLNYFLLSTAGQRQIDSFQAGGNRQGLNFAQIRSFFLPLPPLPEQCAIAAALSDVDALIGALDRLIAKKRNLTQAAMQQLLTGQTRMPGFHEEWEVKLVGEIGKFTKGKGISKDEVVADGLPCIRYGEIYTHHNDQVRTFLSFITLTTAKQSQRIAKGVWARGANELLVTDRRFRGYPSKRRTISTGKRGAAGARG